MTGFIDYSNRKNSTSTAPSTPHGMETTSSDSEAPTKSSGAATGHLREDAPEVEQHVKVVSCSSSLYRPDRRLQADERALGRDLG